MLVLCYQAVLGMMEIEKNKKIKIEVGSKFISEESEHEECLFLFKYDVSIYNNTMNNVQLLNRHWKIFDALGNIRTVNGEGVIGQKPVINSGLSFSYSSFCPLKTEFGKMNGYYTFKDELTEELFEIIIPEFSLITTKNIN